MHLESSYESYLHCHKTTEKTATNVYIFGTASTFEIISALLPIYLARVCLIFSRVISLYLFPAVRYKVSHGSC